VQTTHIATFDQPVWRYRAWILSVINGAGPSGAMSAPATTPASVGNGSGQRALAAAEGSLPMTLPPQTDRCDPGMTSCTGSEPTWPRGVLAGSGTYRGVALARCAVAAGSRCSVGEVSHAGGASVRIPLGTVAVPTAPGTREVLVWCKTETAFPAAGSPTRAVLRVSFTNADPDESPDGYGWWDLTPDQVGTGSGNALVDTGSLARC
jgi:hypothetical protein